MIALQISYLPTLYSAYNRRETEVTLLKSRAGEPAWGPELPLAPFFGTMGVAPDPSMGRISSGPPGVHSGNMDNKDLIAGTTLFMPIQATGALFSIGDAHAAQGNGEVNLTGIETAFREFNITVDVIKGRSLEWPRAETPTHWIAAFRDHPGRPRGFRGSGKPCPPGIKICSAQQRRRTPPAFAAFPGA